MKKLIFLNVIFLFLVCGEAEKQTQQPLKVIELTGSAYNRGLIHGKTLKKEIRQIVNRWSDITEMIHGLNMDDMKVDYLKKTQFKKSIEKWTPDLLDEINGIADGAGIDRDLIFLLQISEEFEHYTPDSNMFKCTAIGVNKTDDSPTYIAQNMEPVHFLQGYPTLLHIKYEKTNLETYIFTFPGFIGLNGLNNKAVGVTVNGLPDYYHKKDGLPVSCVVRGILEKTTFEDAVDFLYEIDHAKAQNYIVGGVDSALGLECDSEEIYIFKAAENEAITYHTNDYLVADYVTKYCSRLATMREELEKRNFELEFKDIKDILSSRRYNAGRPICHYNTYGCTIMVISDEPELHITAGRPDENPFQVFSFGNKN